LAEAIFCTHRAEQVFVMRAVARQPWSKIRDTLGFGSVGAAQMAYRRFLARNLVPDGKTVFAEIIERKRVTLRYSKPSRPLRTECRH
jgi:hypothetical protein